MVDQGFVSIGSPNPNTTTYSIREETSGSTQGVEVRPQMGILFTATSNFSVSFTAAYGYSTLEWNNDIEVLFDHLLLVYLNQQLTILLLTLLKT